MNIFKKFLYFILSAQEKRLAAKLDKHLKSSASTKTSKTVLGANVTMTFNTETEKNKELVLNTVTEIVSGVKGNPNMLIEYIKTHGTRVFRIKKADKILSLINEEEGLICELKGFEALYLNLLTDSGFKFKSKPMFILREVDGETEPYYILHNFYKWFSLYKGLPGFEFEAQKLFKKYLKASDSKGIENLTLNEMTLLKEAIARDQEATDFVLNFAKSIEGSKKVLDKMKNDGGANI